MPGITPIADVPDAPTIGTATGSGLAASITFTAATTGGTPTTFTATSNPGSLTGTASSSPVTVSGLTGDTSYTFTVTAGNSTGTSPASAASNSITAVAPISGGYDALATVIVPSGGLASVTFGGIPSEYKHLQIKGFARLVGSATYGTMIITLNGDSGNNYSYHELYGVGSGSATGYGIASQTGCIFITGSAQMAVQVLDILDYQNTNKNKTLRHFIGTDNNSGGITSLESGLWINTSAVSTITITGNGANFAQYSSFALYGVK